MQGLVLSARSAPQAGRVLEDLHVDLGVDLRDPGRGEYERARAELLEGPRAEEVLRARLEVERQERGAALRRAAGREADAAADREVVEDQPSRRSLATRNASRARSRGSRRSRRPASACRRKLVPSPRRHTKYRPPVHATVHTIPAGEQRTSGEKVRVTQLLRHPAQASAAARVTHAPPIQASPRSHRRSSRHCCGRPCPGPRIPSAERGRASGRRGHALLDLRDQRASRVPALARIAPSPS